MRLVCDRMCSAVSRTCLESLSCSRFCAKQAIPVTGLPISWATPAARRPTDASRSLLIDFCIKSTDSVFSSISKMTSSLISSIGTPVDFWKVNQRRFPLSSIETLSRIRSSLVTKLVISLFQGFGKSAIELPKALLLSRLVYSEIASFHFKISPFWSRETIPMGNLSKISR